MDHLPFIVVEVVLVFGGAMAFAWWQFRDLRRERDKRQRSKNADARTPEPEEKPHEPPAA